ncbi:MAG TPA: hypothetical protein VK629_08940, partial [Steroidobacteraceae bacterium]|nr:hypothetical protein [Steroidobacteraceae bacterium]
MAVVAETLPPVFALVPTPERPRQEQLQLAIRLMEQGDEDRALSELTVYLAQFPDSKPARYLAAQIQTPLEMLFPADNFTVQLGKGETLSALAGLYLGDVLGFYGLARYNRIDVPAKVFQGQSIRIPIPRPGISQARKRSPLTEETNPALVSAIPIQPLTQLTRSPWTTIREDVAAGRYDSAIQEAERNHLTPDSKQANLLASAYIANAKAVQRTNAAQSGAQAFLAGQLYLEVAGMPEEAMDALQLAAVMDPNDDRTRTLLVAAKSKTADAYYRN